MNKKTPTSRLVVIVYGQNYQANSHRETCLNLAAQIGRLDTALDVRTVPFCDFRHTMSELLEHGTSPSGLVLYKPSAHGHTDHVPSGLLHNFMKLPQSPRAPAIVLCTDADCKEIEQMKAPISALSGIKDDIPTCPASSGFCPGFIVLALRNSPQWGG